MPENFKINFKEISGLKLPLLENAQKKAKVRKKNSSALKLGDSANHITDKDLMLKNKKVLEENWVPYQIKARNSKEEDRWI